MSQQRQKRLIAGVFLVIFFMTALPSSSAEPNEKDDEDQASNAALAERLEAHRGMPEELIEYPAPFSLSEKIKEAQELAFEKIKLFEDGLTQLKIARRELENLRQKPKHKKSHADLLFEKNLREKIIPSLIVLKSLYAEKTSVFALFKPSGAIIEIQFQEPLDGNRLPARARAHRNRIAGFPTYTPDCVVTRHGGNGHGMNLLVLCLDPKHGFHVLPVLALAHFHVQDRFQIENVPHVYSPYSLSIHTEETVSEGRKYWDALIEAAYADLKQKHIPSRAYHGNFVHEKYSPEFVKNLLIDEHMDHAQFNEATAGNFPQASQPAAHLHPLKLLVEKFFVILGTNKDRAYIFSLSKNRNPKLRAYGISQFIEGSYRDVTRFAPEAQLEKDFQKGMRDHVNAVKAMVLLFDRDLSHFSEKARRICGVSEDFLEDCLAVAYNGGVERLNGVIETYGSEWDEQKSVARGRRLLKRGLTHETNMYIEKLRAIRAFERSTAKTKTR